MSERTPAIAAYLTITALLLLNACKRLESPLMPTLRQIHSGVQLTPILTAVAPVAAGQGVDAAWSYGGDPLHHVVLIAASGAVHSWSYSLPSEWWPASVTDIQLVVVVGEQQKVEYEAARYTNCYDVVRSYKRTMNVKVREARTALLIGEHDFETVPDRLPAIKQSCADEEASPVQFSTLSEWVRTYVTTTVPPSQFRSQVNPELTLSCGRNEFSWPTIVATLKAPTLKAFCLDLTRTASAGSQFGGAFGSLRMCFWYDDIETSAAFAFSSTCQAQGTCSATYVVAGSSPEPYLGRSVTCPF